MLSTIVLMGPVNVGKSTIATLLAQHLGWPRCSLDQVCQRYYEEMGYDPALARSLQEHTDLPTVHRSLERFHAHVVKRVLADHPQAVIDFGAGHSVYTDAGEFARVQQALAPYPNVVLLLPSPDLAESLHLLSQRASHQHSGAMIRLMNEFFFSQRSSYDLAKSIVYTKEHTPEHTCQEVLKHLTL